jgi:hypothetical protein
MADHKPLYRDSRDVAWLSGKMDAWRESHGENIRCRDFIMDSISRNYNGMRLDGDTAGEAIAEFGYDRVNLVLANTIQLKTHDGRISAKNKAWAKGFFIPHRQDDQWNYRRDYLIDEPGLVNLVANQARRAYEQLHLFGKAQCIPIQEFQDVAGHVLVLKPEELLDEYKSPDFQLVLAKNGSGCRPKAIGRSIFGQFLINGEPASYCRQDFLGVLKPELLPAWAVEKLRELEPGQSPELKQPREPEQASESLHIKLYQVNWERDTEHKRFANLNDVKGTPQVDASLYDEVFSGTVPSGRFVDLLVQFNNNPPSLHRGRSMGRSDVFVAGDQCGYVDAAGFRYVKFDTSLAHKRDDLLRVVVIEPGMPGYEGEIAPDIDSLQRIAGRYDTEACAFEILSLLEAGDMSAWLAGVAGVTQADGSLNPEPIFIIGGDGDGGYCSLTDEQAAFFLEEFSQVEEISMEDIQGGTGMKMNGY